jgi:hypothetical protein
MGDSGLASDCIGDVFAVNWVSATRPELHMVLKAAKYFCLGGIESPDEFALGTRIFVGTLVFALCLGSTSAFAQGGTSPGQGGPPGGHRLDLGATLFGSYSDNTLADIARTDSVLTGAPQRGQENQGVYTGFNGSLSYRFNTQKAKTSFDVNARTTGSYYPDLDIKAVQHTADIAVSRPLGGRTTVRFTQSARASSHFRLELFPDTASDETDAVLTLGDEFAVVQRQTYTYTTAASLSRMITKRASVGVNYGLRYVDSPDGDFDFMNHNAGASFKYRLTRYGGFRVSYDYQDAPRYAGQSQEETPFQSNSVNVGIDYNRPFSLTGRRTSLIFTTGSSLFAAARDEQRGDQSTSSNNLRPVLLGGVTLRQNLGRTWDAQAGYRRSVAFLEGFTQPILTDGASASIGGQITNRAKLSGLVAYSSGSVGLSRSRNNGLGSQTASAILDVPLTRHFAFSTIYFYVKQRIGTDVILPQDFPRELDRHSVRLALTFRLPLIS